MGNSNMRIRSLIARRLPAFVIKRTPERFLKLGFPSRVIIETTNVCNLRCLMCPTPISKRERGYMDLGKYKKLIDELVGYPTQLTLYFSGEPLLHNDLFKMIEYASERGLETSISTNTTLLHKHIDEIFESGLDNLVVCLDGISKDTHEFYRVGSDFNRVKRNIELICKEKRKRNAEKPQIIIQTLAMKRNEKEIPKIFEFAKKTESDVFRLKTLGIGYTNMGNKMELAKKLLPSSKEYSRYVVDEDDVKIKKRAGFCTAFSGCVILWNGDVCVCCADYEGRYRLGNAFDEGLMNIWRSQKYTKMRKKILNRNLDICRFCNETSGREKDVNIKQEPKARGNLA